MELVDGCKLKVSHMAHAWDIARFARERLGFEADTVQATIMNAGVHRGLLNCTRQWGKSTITAIMAVHRAYFAARSLTIAVSPSGRQTGEFVRKAKEFAGRLGIKARGDGDNEISMLFPNGSRIVGLPGTEATVRGFSAVSLMVVDEAARVSDDLYKAIRPFLAVGGGDLWLMSTPYGKRGFFYEEWSGEGKWARFKVPAKECARIPAQFLEGEKASMGDRWYRQEYLCEFTEANAALFDRDAILRAFTPDVKPMFFD